MWIVMSLIKQLYGTYKDNEKLSPVVRELPQDTKYVFKDTYVLELLGLPKRHKEKDDKMVKYALSRCQSPTVIADYDTKLIPKELLKRKVEELYRLYDGERDENMDKVLEK